MQIGGATSVYVRKGVALFAGRRVFVPWDKTRGLAAQEDGDLPFRLCPISSTDESLGATLREVLLESPGEPFRTWYGHYHKGQYYEERIRLGYDPDANRKLARNFGLSSTKTLFSGTRYIYVEMLRGEVTIVPTWRDGAFFNDFRDDYPPKAPATLSFSSTDAELGAALRDVHARSSG